MVDNKNKGTDEDFDDDGFDVDELPDTDYDDAAFDEELSADEADLSEGEFDEEWQDENQPAAKSKKSVSRGEKKSLSFNTIVIIIAVILGVGVLFAKVSSETSEQQEAQGSQFLSSINISGILDGTLFGSDTETQKPEEGQETPPQPEQETGFLNEPNDATPPQPTPITPLENTNETAATPGALTPMPQPEESAEQMPRGPEEVTSLEEDQTQPAPSAESAADILNRAKELREQKAEENIQAVSQPAPEIPVAETQVPAAPMPVLAPSRDEQSVIKQGVFEGDGVKIMQVLEEKIGQVLNRMGGIEQDIADVKESQKSDYKKLEDRMTSIQGEIDNLKNRPASMSSSVASDEKTNVKAAPKKKVKRKMPAEEGAYYAGQGPSYTSVPTAWELRAAQPGRAWVSKPGAKDMQSVMVGDKLPGVGQVTNIVYQNGRWLVQGTTGQILQ